MSSALMSFDEIAPFDFAFMSVDKLSCESALMSSDKMSFDFALMSFDEIAPFDEIACVCCALLCTVVVATSYIYIYIYIYIYVRVVNLATSFGTWAFLLGTAALYIW